MKEVEQGDNFNLDYVVQAMNDPSAFKDDVNVEP